MSEPVRVLLLQPGHWTVSAGDGEAGRVSEATTVPVFIVEWKRQSNFDEAVVVLREPVGERPAGTILRITAYSDESSGYFQSADGKLDPWTIPAHTFLTVDLDPGGNAA